MKEQEQELRDAAVQIQEQVGSDDASEDTGGRLNAGRPGPQRHSVEEAQDIFLRQIRGDADEPPEAEAPEPSPDPEQPKPERDVDDVQVSEPDALYSSEDFETYSRLTTHGEQWQEDYQKLEQFKQKTDISNLSAADKEALKAAEDEMEYRRQVLEQAAQSLDSRVGRRKAKKETQALYRKAPPLKDRAELEATVEHMRSLGASDQELAQINDHRVVLMAWESMQYRKMNGGKGPTKGELRRRARKLTLPRNTQTQERPPAPQNYRSHAAKPGTVDAAARKLMDLGIVSKADFNRA